MTLAEEKIVREAGLPEGTRVDKTIEQRGTYIRAVFDVDKYVSDARVQQKADWFKRKFGNHLEKQGFTVLGISDPIIVPQKMQELIDPTRRKYGVLAWVTRRPVQHTIDVPDSAVPALQELGMALKE